MGRGGPYNGKGTPCNGNISIVKGTLPVIRPTPGLITGRVADFAAEKTEKVEYIRPGPSIRYKAIGGLLSVIRPGPYMRGNTVVYSYFDPKFSLIPIFYSLFINSLKHFPQSIPLPSPAPAQQSNFGAMYHILGGGKYLHSSDQEKP